MLKTLGGAYRPPCSHPKGGSPIAARATATRMVPLAASSPTGCSCSTSHSSASVRGLVGGLVRGRQPDGLSHRSVGHQRPQARQSLRGAPSSHPASRRWPPWPTYLPRRCRAPRSPRRWREAGPMARLRASRSPARSCRKRPARPPPRLRPSQRGKVRAACVVEVVEGVIRRSHLARRSEVVALGLLDGRVGGVDGRDAGSGTWRWAVHTAGPAAAAGRPDQRQGCSDHCTFVTSICPSRTPLPNDYGASGQSTNGSADGKMPGSPERGSLTGSRPLCAYLKPLDRARQFSGLPKHVLSETMGAPPPSGSGHCHGRAGWGLG